MSIMEGVKMSMDEIISGMTSADKVLQLKATQGWSEMLSQKILPINTIIPEDIVLRCIEFLSFHHNPALQFEASLALTNVIASTSEMTMIMVNNGAIPKLIELMKSPHINVAEHAIWALGKIAEDGPETRDQILSHNCMPLLLDFITPVTPVSLTRNIVRTISNLCIHKNRPPSFEIVRIALPVLNHLLSEEDPHILTFASWALARLANQADGEEYRIQAVVDSGVVPKLVTLLASSEVDILFPALRAVGNITTGNDTQTDVIIDAGGLENLKKLLEHQNPDIVKDAAWTLSNITAGTREQIQRVIDAGIVPLVAQLVSEGDPDVKRDVARVAENLFARASGVQIEELIRQGAFLPLQIPLDAEDEQDVLINCRMDGLSIAEGEKGGGNGQGINSRKL